MTKFSDVNNIIGADGGGEAFFRFKQVLKSGSWTVKASGDGTTFSSSSDIFTSSSTGGGGMNNPLAWFRIQEPGGRREYVVQHSITGANDHQWRIKFLESGSFLGGGGATITPSGSGEVFLLGSGSDAAPTFASLFTAAGGGYRYHVVAQSTGEGGVFGFWSFATTTPAGASISAFMHDPLLAGTYPTEDVSPVVIYCRNAAPTVANITSESGAGTFRGFFKYGLAGQIFQIVGCMGNNSITNSATTNPYNSKDQLLPIGFGQSTTNIQFKGVSKYIRWAVFARGYPYTLDLTTDAKIYINGIALPWPDNIAAIL